MRDLTKTLLQNHPEAAGRINQQLLRIAANVGGGGVALAGGYLRDTLFSLKVPKDWDFAFYGMLPSDMESVLRMYIDRSPYDCTVTDITSDTEGYELEAAAGRIFKVLHIVESAPGYEAREMDWILYNANSAAEVMSRLDYCVNKFTAEFDSMFKLNVYWHGDQWGVCTRNPSAVISPEREARFVELARQIDWEYVE